MEENTDLTESFEYLPPPSGEDLLSQFVGITGADPSLAQDILSTANQNLEMAVEMYRSMMDPPPAPPTLQTDVILKEDTPSNTDEVRNTKRRQRKWRKKGIVCVGPDVQEKFHQESKFKCSKVDVGEELVPVIDDKFFQHTFLFPNVSVFTPSELMEFLSNDLLEISHKKSLERTGRLNWWTATGQCPPLEPLATSGDGNCLLHAASLGMWGIPDNSLILRSAVHKFLSTSSETEGVKRRWKYQLEQQFQEQGGFTLSDEEWEKEWSELIRIARSEERQSSASKEKDSNTLRRNSTIRPNYESLEEIHVFVLAHVLKRPVIVLANTVLQDMHGQDFAPIYFSGVYLPLEYNPKHCFKSPMVLAYEAAHFSPLLARDTPSSSKQSKVLKVNLRNQAVIPLVSPDGHMLPLQFVVDPKRDNIEEFKKLSVDAAKGDIPQHYITLLESYMDIRWISLSVNKTAASQVTTPTDTPWKVPSMRFPAAQILYPGRPAYQESLLKSYFTKALERFEEYQEECREMEEERIRRQEEAANEVPGEWERMPCRTDGCPMFGTVETEFLCSQCYRSQEGTGVQGNPPRVDDSTTNLAEERTEDLRPVDLPQTAADQTQLLTVDSPEPTQAVEDVELTDHTGTNASTNPSTQQEKASTKSVSEKAITVAKKIAETVKRSPVLGPKRTPYTRGYSRDQIQPLGKDEVPDKHGVGAQKRPICKSEDCDFFGSEESNGYCSQCFRKQNL